MILDKIPEIKNKKALVLVSGGMDSRTCLQYAYKTLGKDNVFALCMFYGQKHDKELKFAEESCKKLGVKLYVQDLSPIFKFNVNVSALLQGSNREIQHESYEEQMRELIKEDKPLISSAYVPYRNGLFLSAATSIAIQLNCNYILYGAHSDDSNVKVDGIKVQAYPDCTEQFISSLNDAIYEGSGKTVQLVAPLWNKTKSEVAQFGKDYGMIDEDFKNTWSCYEGKEKECGSCGTCVDKIKALRSINIPENIIKEMFEKVD